MFFVASLLGECDFVVGSIIDIQVVFELTVFLILQKRVSEKSIGISKGTQNRQARVGELAKRVRKTLQKYTQN